MIDKYLRGCGCRVGDATTTDQAMSVLRTDDYVDIVFSDVQMPGRFDGLGLAAWIRRERPDVKLILTSDVPGAAAMVRGLCTDGPLMSRPYEPEEVVRRIRTLLEQ